MRTPGKQDVTLEMFSADSRLAAGHRIGVRVTDNNSEWWVLAAPTMTPVTVNGGSVALPFLKFQRPNTIEGEPGVQLASYLEQTEDASGKLAAGQSASFAVPPALVAPSPGDPGTPESFAAANRLGQTQAQTIATTGATNAGSGTAGSPAAGKRLTARILRVAKHRHMIRVRGKAPAGSRVLVRLIRNKTVVAKKRVRIGASGTYRVTFRHVRKGRYHVRSYVNATGTKLHARTKALRVR